MGPSSQDDLREACLRRVGMVIQGKYVLNSLIGFGATGAVYHSENRWAGRECAVKLFHYRGADQQSVLKRFVREAQAANRVLRHGRLHPNVVDIFDVGRDPDSGFFYTVQEFLRGATLAQHLYNLPDRQMDHRAAVALLRPVIDAIAAAHDAGIVHRDIKPENVILNVRDEGSVAVPKVLDFGIAQLQDARMTPTHELLGTPQYMPPEAFTGASEVDARADVWALGVILYEMVAGVSPFAAPGSNPIESMRLVTQLQAPSLAAAGRMPHPLWNVVRRSLSKDAGERYPNARELLDALDAALTPMRVLRVPAGVSPMAVREALLAGGGALRDAIRTAPSGDAQGEDEADAPEASADPTRAWWSVMFHMSGHTAEDVVETLALPELANLVELHVVGLPLGDDGARALAASPRLAALTILSLRKTGVGPDGARALAESPYVANLVKLDLEENPIGSDGAAALADSPGLANLRMLNLVLTDTDADGARALAEGSLLGRLARLDLSQNRLGEEGVRALVESPRLTPQLWLVLARNRLSRAAADAAGAVLRDRIRKVVM